MNSTSSQSSPKLRIGLLGCGKMAQQAHLPALLCNPHARLVALADLRPNVAQTLCAQHGIPHAVSSLDALLDLPIDAVYILTPAGNHLTEILRALEAGKHVFTEKPAALCAASVRLLRDAAAASGKTVAVGYMKRHDPNLDALLEARASGDWGQLLFIRAHAFIGRHWDAAIGDLLPTVEGPVDPDAAALAARAHLDPGPDWLDAPRDSVFYSFGNPYFALLDTGCHSVNLLRHLTGITPEVSRATSKGSLRLVEFDFAGTPGTFEFCLNFSMDRWDEVTELYFERATVTVRTPPPLDRQNASEVSIYTEKDGLHQLRSLQNHRQWSFRLQAQAFVRDALSGRKTRDLEDAESDVGLIESIFRQTTLHPASAL